MDALQLQQKLAVHVAGAEKVGLFFVIFVLFREFGVFYRGFVSYLLVPCSL
jgi:hypothetical protein